MKLLSSRRMSSPTFIAVAAGIAIVVVGLVIFFTQIHSGSGKTASPKAVTNAWLRASRDNDVNGLRSLSCKVLADQIRQNPRNFQNFIEPQLISWTILKTTQHGEQADVDLALHYTVGSGTAATFEVVHADGEWKVCELSGFGS